MATKAPATRKIFNTSMRVELLDLLKKVSGETGIPMNRLIENAVIEKYRDKKEIRFSCE